MDLSYIFQRKIEIIAFSAREYIANPAFYRWNRDYTGIALTGFYKTIEDCV